jgi:hypothetical protein
VYYGNQGQLEYDFVVQPGADPHSIQLAIASDEHGPPESQSAIANRQSSIPAPLRIDANGDLMVGTNSGEVIFHKPVVYQPDLPSVAGSSLVTRQSSLVEGYYRLEGENHIRFEVGPYDRSRPVVIDPVLAYSSYLPGQGDAIAVDVSSNAYIYNGCVWKLNAAGSALIYSTCVGGSVSPYGGNAIAVDASGNAYITGYVGASLPTTPGAFQTTYGGGNSDAFLSKLNADGSTLLYSTYLGGSGDDGGAGIAVDALGSAYVTGSTTSTDFPIAAGGFQTTCAASCSGNDAFVSKLNAGGSALAYSTYLGGGFYDVSQGIAVDTSGNAYVTGWTLSRDFPTTTGAFQTTFRGSRDAFVSELNAGGSALLYSTFLSGSGTTATAASGIAVDTAGNAYVTGGTYSQSSSNDFPTTPGAFQTTFAGGGDAFGGGTDAFVSKFNAAGSGFVYSTYLGGSGNEDPDPGDGSALGGIALDSAGNAYVTGQTFSSNFPITAAIQTTPSNCFVTKLNTAGSALLYSTYLGTSRGDAGLGIAVDRSGNAYVTGGTNSSDFPVTPGAFQTTLVGKTRNGFVAKISSTDAPGVALAPASLTFGPQNVGTTSAPKKVALLDAGSQPLSITSIAVSGDFAQTNSCGSAVPTGGRCTISVTFKPTATGTRSGTVAIADNAAGSPHNLLLAGTGLGGPTVSLTPTSLTFAAQAVGTTSPPQQASLKNVGNETLNITSIAASGDFAQTNNCGSAVAASASCTLTVTFTPTATGTRTGAITITDNATGSPQRVLLTGIGGFGQPAVTLTPASLTFAAQPVGTFSTTKLVILFISITIFDFTPEVVNATLSA